MMKRILRTFSLFVPVAVGAVLYYVFCPEVLFVQAVDSWIGRRLHAAADYSCMTVRLLRYYLFDFLWAYSLMALTLSLSGGKRSDRIIIPGVLLFEAAMELLQLAPFVKGTFDVWDLFVELIADVIVIIIFIIRRRKNEET